ncbi:MAG: Asp23/Gls24 family envelope stress response protein [Anaerolineales bacterium]
MSNERTPLGTITLAPRAVATIASHIALQSYGVVGMASRNLADGLVKLLARDPRHGVEVHVEEGSLAIDLFVIIEYGTPIAAVTQNLTKAVRFQVERILGLPVTRIHVHVQGLHMSPDA